MGQSTASVSNIFFFATTQGGIKRGIIIMYFAPWFLCRNDGTRVEQKNISSFSWNNYRSPSLEYTTLALLLYLSCAYIFFAGEKKIVEECSSVFFRAQDRHSHAKKEVQEKEKKKIVQSISRCLFPLNPPFGCSMWVLTLMEGR